MWFMDGEAHEPYPLLAISEKPLDVVPDFDADEERDRAEDVSLREGWFASLSAGAGGEQDCQPGAEPRRVESSFTLSE